MSYGTATGRIERCQNCMSSFDVDELGRVPPHRECKSYHAIGPQRISSGIGGMCPKGGHPSRAEMKRRKDARHAARVEAAKAQPVDVQVALDSYIEGRDEYAELVPEWRRAALAFYNETHQKRYRDPYEYKTRCAPDSRRAGTLGDIFCRFCGDILFRQVKYPHDLVRDSKEAQRHLTICALTIVAGMREPVKPGQRNAAPLEKAMCQIADDGPLFGGKRCPTT